ncbi:PucR family transcriptional regulator ligand-binding domain-containing protein [Nocardioides ochotonae]|uniref:PucR family transcriptional regulator ligand-binding domain-containing protein n=1 Tax=Nocardioides ochotonae TaxID=2685869 RepID=UPI00140D6479
MLPTLREVLALPSFRAAAPEVLGGPLLDLDAVSVRWVHSSEVYEIAGLLAGGEVLLTTGLGLHGRTAAQLTAYVDQLADAGCAALALEIGRSFFEVPAPIVLAAQRRGLPLVALHTVVPFVRMIEDFHDLAVRRRPDAPRLGERVWQEVLAPVVHGQGMRALLDAAARLAGCSVELVDVDGTLVERSRVAVPEWAGECVSADVRGPGGPAGQVVLRGRASARRGAVLQRLAVAVALELGRHPGGEQRPSLAQAVVTDLAAGAIASAADLRDRLAAAGWLPTPGRHLLVAALDVDPRVPAHELVAPLRDALTAELGPVVVGAAGSQVVGLCQGWSRPLPQRVRATLTAAYDALGTSGGGARVLAAAAPVADLADVGAAVAQAREVVQVARRVGTRAGVVLARDLGVPRLLAAGSTPTATAAFVAEQLGPLLEYDIAATADLMRTLDAFVAHSASKSRTAAALGIRRQSLYARLERIERLLGVSLDDPTQLTCLAVALTAWRMRTGLDPQTAFG